MVNNKFKFLITKNKRKKENLKSQSKRESIVRGY